MSTEAKTLLREAEISAARSIAYARCVIGISVAIFFFVVVAPTLQPGNPALNLVPIFIAFCIGYFLVGVATFFFTHRDRFRGWMTWLFATLDLGFWFGLLAATVLVIQLPGNRIVVVPPALIVFIILAIVALHNNPWLQAYTVAAVISAFFALYLVAPPPTSGPVGNAGPQIGFFELPLNIVRLLMVTLTGLILVYLSVRTRRLLNRAIDETVRRVNLSRYLPAQLTGRLAEIDEDRLLSGTSQEAAVLFVDIRGFAALAEGLNPKDLSAFLGNFREIVSRQVHANDGIVDKFVGDSVMAVFGAPDPSQEDAANALKCADDIVRSIAAWNAELRASNRNEIRIGIGIHWGEVFCGAIGDTNRLEFTVLGDTVNVAARLEQLTKKVGFPVVASRSVLSRAGLDPDPGPDRVPEAGWIAVGDMPIRGRKSSLPVFARH